MTTKCFNCPHCKGDENLRPVTEEDLKALPREALLDVACMRLANLEKRGMYLTRSKT